ncbi:MAG TPA: hypothetical protein VLC98_02745 [Phnomibacter sp.]|nr:hypothetical protein [Phnomibacter sp.]
MVIPAALLLSIQNVQGFHEESFLQVHAAQQPPTSIRINAAKWDKVTLPFASSGIVPWCSTGYFLPQRPSFSQDPLWHAGAYYVQEASSMALQLVFDQLVPFAQQSSLKVLDLCAAPGGKSTHVLSMLRPTDVLVSNEVIGSRVNILLENITRWGAAHTIVTNNDPADFTPLQGLFDVMVIDAPCSGSGLFRRDPQAIEEWSEPAVEKCRQRQERILADAWPALKEDGILVYTTCSYSPSENEQMVDWMHDHFECASLQVQTDPSWGIVETASPKHGHKCYRFFPNLVRGEGFFMAIFQKKEPVQEMIFPKKKVNAKQEIPTASLMKEWVQETGALQLYKHKDTLYAMPTETYELFLGLQDALRIRKAGVCLGEWMHNGLQPDHALAMSHLLHPSIHRVELSLPDALQFLRKETVVVEASTKGWMLATYEAIPLGWIKHLGNRTNNYYPKEWRLRK